jgi:hypothetical protein
MVRSRERSNRTPVNELFATEAGRRLEAVKPTHQLLKTAFKKREISCRCLEDNLDAVRRQSDERKRI